MKIPGRVNNSISPISPNLKSGIISIAVKTRNRILREMTQRIIPKTRKNISTKNINAKLPGASLPGKLLGNPLHD
jgi:hypothetical protein